MIEIPRTPSFRLEGKRALIAGASSGIGFAAAAALAQAGAIVTLAARSADRLEEATSALQNEGHEASSLVLDISQIDETESRVADAAPFDILVNSAGLARHTPASLTTQEDFDDVANVNFKGAYFLTKAVAQALIAANKPGSLINISSQMGIVGGYDRAVYAATKHAVEGFTKSMAIEFGPAGIRVNTICPTFIETPLTAKTFDDPTKRKWIEEKIKLGRIAVVEDIMGAVTYLASDASGMVTGTALLVDGGWTAD